MSDPHRRLWRPPAAEEVDQELEFHVEMRAREYRARGMDATAARRLARARFGDINAVRATCTSLGLERERNMRRAAKWAEFRQDFTHAFALLRRAPLLTFVLVLTLGLGIGANTALFSVVKSVLLAPLPYANPDEVVVLWSRWKDFPDGTWVSLEEFQNYRASIRSFAGLSLLQQYETNITEGDNPERVTAVASTYELFQVLGVSPVAGRLFNEDDAVEDQGGVVIAHSLWQRRFAGDPDAVGRTLLFNGEPVPILGVLPPGFRLPIEYRTATPAQVFFTGPLPAWDGAMPSNGGNHGYTVIGRLARGATVPGANRELRALTDELTRAGTYPPDWNFGAFVVSAPDEVAGDVRPALLVLLGAVGFVLLIACANVANLLLVRAEERRRELSVRAALGASRGRLLRQLLTENLLYALAGGTLGLGIAWGGVRGLIAVAPASLPRIPEVRIDATVLGFTAALAVLTAFLFGLLPALHGARTNLQQALKEGGRAHTVGAHRMRVRQAMVVAQIALAVVLVAGAGLMLRSFSNLLDIDPGFESDGVLTARLAPPVAYYPQAADVNAFYDRLLTAVRAVPGVEHAGLIRVLPIDAQIGDAGIMVEGYVNENGTPFGPSDWQAASDGYFEAMRMELVEGRFFTPSDRGRETEQVIIVNESFVDRYFNGGRGVDRRVRFSFLGDSVPMQRVVGVVRNVKHNGITGAVKPTFYRPHQQWQVSTGDAARTMSLVVRTSGDPRALVAGVRRAVASIDPRVPISRVQTMDDVLSAELAQPRFTMALLVVFSVLALTLALIGVYGVVTYVVAQRRAEMGIRVALGAQPGNVIWLALRDALAQTAAGIGIGIAAAFALTRTMAGLMYETDTADPATYGAVVGIAVVTTLIASWLPARRAGTADPLNALRAE